MEAVSSECQKLIDCDRPSFLNVNVVNKMWMTELPCAET